MSQPAARPGECTLEPPVLGPPDPGVGVPRGIDLPGWVPISMPNFNLTDQATMAAEAPIALGHLGEVWNLI